MFPISAVDYPHLRERSMLDEPPTNALARAVTALW